jgi:predicted  nucleic acid-binding Zn-ribbon protein
MPMQAESLEVLEKADVAPAQARAFVRAIEIEIAGAKDMLATKHDLLVLRQDFDGLRKDFDGLRKDFEGLRKDFETIRVELRGEVTGLEARQQLQTAESTATLRTEMAKHGAELRTEIARSVGGVTRQMYMAILGQMAVLLGFTYFFATHLR